MNNQNNNNVVRTKKKIIYFYKNIRWTFFISIFINFVIFNLFFINEINGVALINNNNNNNLFNNSNHKHIIKINLIKYTNNNNIEINGDNFMLKNYEFLSTTSSSECNPNQNISLKLIKKTDNLIMLAFDNTPKMIENGDLYLCVREMVSASAQNGVSDSTSNVFYHLGTDSKLLSLKHREKRDPSIRSNESNNNAWDDNFHLSGNPNPLHDDRDTKVNEQSKNIKIFGLRVEQSDKEASMEDGMPKLLMGSPVLLRIFGTGLTDDTVIAFTLENKKFGGSCFYPVTDGFKLVPGSVQGTTALVNIELPKSGKPFFMCAKHADNGTRGKADESFLHQGNDSYMAILTYENLLPIWAAICIICICLIFSALFSGLNLGLMSLDRTDLKILCNTGTEKERRYAKAIQPVRDHGNYLLCSILLGNVLVNSTFTILLDSLTSGLIAVVCSTIAIVIFGEITPQAVCSRHGLAVGAKTIFITKAVMAVTFPLSYPTSKVLDIMLGEEIGNVYNRERLKELVKLTTDVNDLDKDEVNIISGALELRKKTVGDIMTHIEDAFMLPLDAILDFETVSEIMKSGFSRIPVYEDNRNNIITLLYIKDLAFVDPDDNTPLKTLCEFYQNPCHFVFEDLTLDIMFKQFKEGHRGHMAFVHRVNNEGDCDPFYEIIGLVTLEDVIEELIQAEIVDETDVFTDNRTKIRRSRIKKQDFSAFAERRDTTRNRISPQLTLATFQYLSTTIDAFKPEQVSETILRRLLNQDIVHHLKCKGKDRNDPSMLIYHQGKPVDYFVLILEGRVEVTVGRENLVFESGPFSYFGIQALVQNVPVVESPSQIKGSLQSLNMEQLLRHTFVPDYSVRAVTEVVYLTIKRTLYLAAKRATLMERSQKYTSESGEALDDEVEKLLHSLDEDERSITHNYTGFTPRATSKPPSNTPSPVTTEPHSNGPFMPTTITEIAPPTIPVTIPASPHTPIVHFNLRNNNVAHVTAPPEDESDIPLLPRSKS